MPATSHIESLGSTATAEHHAGTSSNHPIGGRVVIVDRHALVAQSLAMVLATVSVTTFIATDPSFELVLRQIRAFDPDLVLVEAGAGDSMELIRAIARLGHRVVAISDGSDRLRVAACLEAGANGAVSTLDPVPRLLGTIRETVAGRRVMPTAAERDLLCELQSHRRDRAAQLSRFHQLSVRESEVLEELMAGKAAVEIATESYVSIATIRSQIKAILRKLGVNSQLAAVALAYRSGWSRMSLRATAASGRRPELSTPRR
jgi:two-component system, NarL family, nitrate/nitrite response regulator NarL